MKNKVFTVIGILTVLSLFFNSCKKEECETCQICPTNEIKNISGKWKLVEYSVEVFRRYKGTTTNNINNDIYIRDEISSNVRIFNNGILKESNVDSAYYYLDRSYYNENTNSFDDTTYTNINVNTEKFTYLYSCEIEISNDEWKSKAYKSMNYSFRSELYLREGDTASYMVWGGDSLIIPVDSTIENGNLYWDGNIIEAGPMNGKVKSITDNEIIIEETIIKNDKEFSVSIKDSIYTFSDINNPYLKEYGVIGTLYNDEDITKKYYKWVAE